MLKTYYLSLQGRCDRQQYWLYGVLPFAVVWVAVYALARLIPVYPSSLYPLLLLSLWPLVTMQVKRYHDLDMSGWFALLLLLPFLGKVITIIVGLLPGKPGENRYGADLQGRPGDTAELRQLHQSTVIALFLSGFIAYLVFASLTGLEEFGLSARDEERWALWRYIIVSAWLLVAAVIYLARGQQAYQVSLLVSLATGFTLSLFLLLLFVNAGEGHFALIGTACTYAFIAGMLCMTFKNPVIAFVCAIVFFALQIVTDAAVLAIAGNMRIH